MSENKENYEGVQIELGDIVKAKVIKLEDKHVTVDFGYKFDGIIPISELSHLHVETTGEVVSEGDEIEVVVKKIEDDAVVLSKRDLERMKAWEELKSHLEDESLIEGQVI